MRDEWYVARRGQDGNKRYGPVPLSQLRDLMDSGNVRPDDLVWQEGMANWQRADQCDVLSPPAPAPRSRPRDYPPDDRRDYGYGGPRGNDPRDDDRPNRRRYPPPQSSNGWVVGLVVGGIVAALCFLGLGGLVFAALVSNHSSPTYTTYPASYTPATGNWNNNFPDDPPPFQDPNQWQPNPPIWEPPPPPEPIFVPDPNPIFVPDPNPIFVPDPNPIFVPDPNPIFVPDPNP